MHFAVSSRNLYEHPFIDEQQITKHGKEDQDFITVSFLFIKLCQVLTVFFIALNILMSHDNDLFIDLQCLHVS